MKCPACMSSKSFIVDSRAEEKCVRRKRRCESCSHTWHTVEIVPPYSEDDFDPVTGSKQALLLQMHTLQKTIAAVMEKLGGVEKAEATKLTKKIRKETR